MEIHLYALCWNELDFLPFFFRHYDRFVTKYFIFDNASRDGSVEFLRSRANVELQRFIPSDPDSFVLSEQSLSNQCWKASSGVADWVIVTDIDEHLFHPRLPELLRSYKYFGITLAPALGYEMISDEFPDCDELLCETRTRGMPTGWYCKASIFDPTAIAEISYGFGRHLAAPAGDVRMPHKDELRLLHFKRLGFERTLRRYRQLQTGLGSADLKNGWGIQYSCSDAEFAAEWRDISAASIDLYTDVAVFDFPAPPWWERLRSGSAQGADPCRMVQPPIGKEGTMAGAIGPA